MLLAGLGALVLLALLTNTLVLRKNARYVPLNGWKTESELAEEMRSVKYLSFPYRAELANGNLHVDWYLGLGTVSRSLVVVPHHQELLSILGKSSDICWAMSDSTFVLNNKETAALAFTLSEEDAAPDSIAHIDFEIKQSMIGRNTHRVSFNLGKCPHGVVQMLREGEVDLVIPLSGPREGFCQVLLPRNCLGELGSVMAHFAGN